MIVVGVVMIGMTSSKFSPARQAEPDVWLGRRRVGRTNEGTWQQVRSPARPTSQLPAQSKRVSALRLMATPVSETLT